MSQASYPSSQAARLAEAARHIAASHGDVRAQTITYALLLRRLDCLTDTSILLDGFDDPTASARVEAVLDAIDVDAVRAHFVSSGRDPAVYFYEDFVRAYDAATARGRGTRYTPPQVVSFMVRGVDWIVGERFGLAMDDAVVVDPCCGVGTFLRHIERRTEHRPRMIGMELMPAACAIAKCLLSRASIIEADWLSDVPIDSDGRLLVILGNPPYSGHSSNAGRIAGLIAEYRAGLDERNPKWLQDDYVKFIRMAQRQVERAGLGVVAFITNHSFLFNPTFRAMRQSLVRTFDHIFALDLGGNVRLNKRDENVFPIQAGVAISFLVRTSDSPGCTVRYASISGTKEQKLSRLASLEPASVPWAELAPVKPFHIFIPQHGGLREEFCGFASLFDIFREHTMGFVTSRDSFAIGFTRDEVLARVGIEHGDDITEVLYRPFDRRWACLSRAVMERPRLPFMRNLMRPNLALAIGRAGRVTGSDEWDVVFVTDVPTDLNLFRRGGAKLFPRYVYENGERVSNVRAGDDQDALFAYIYALLHSGEYRVRYAEFLAIDYQRVPMPRDEQTLRELARLGERLIDVHLMRRVAPSPQPSPPGAGVVVLGGYREPEKFIKDRAGFDGPEVPDMVRWAVGATIEIRAEIDRVIEGNPPW